MSSTTESVTQPLDPRLRKVVVGVLGLLGACAFYAVVIALANFSRIGV